MKNKIIFLTLMVLTIMLFNISYATEDGLKKKIVSIVYDDSGSMMDQNNYCYSDYALQILTASLGKDDELNIVKTSDYTINNVVDLTTQNSKQNYINIIRNYSHYGGTYFDSVNSAKDWLISKSSTYQETADYWLVIITDGEFYGMPDDVNEYFNDINNAFNNLNYECVLLSIGSYTGYQLSSVVSASANSNVLTATDRESIYDSIMEIVTMINNGASDEMISVQKEGIKKIRVSAKYPLSKMMLLMQNTDNYVTKVTSATSSMQIENYNASYYLENLKASLTYVIDPNSMYLDTGYYDIEFNSDVELADINFLCEAFLGCKISIVDENDKELNNAQVNFLTSNNVIKVKCELYNVANGNPITIDEKKVTVQLINGKNKYNMTYNSKNGAYYAEITLIGENNNIYAIADSTNLFRIKSNVIFIDTVAGQANIENYKDNMLKIEIPYSSSDKYSRVDQFIFYFQEDTEYNVATEFSLKLIDVPDGIKFEYEGKEYKNNDVIPMLKEYGKNYQLDILSNKDYSELDDTTITLKLVPNENGTQIYWTDNGIDETYITITPKLNPLKIISKNNGNEIDIQKDKLTFQVARISGDDLNYSIAGYVKVEDIKDITTNSDAKTGFTYKVKKNENDNVIDITFKPNILAIFGDGMVNVEFDILLKNERESAKYSEVFTITNIDVLALLMPYIISVILLIIIIGYVSKKKFNKKSQITITENGERVSYALRPRLITVLLPYVTHKTKIGMIEFKAGKNSDIIYSAKGLDVVKIDGEPLEEYKESHKLNIDKIIMKKDVSSIVINAFDVEQKYEYLTKEVEAGGYDDDYTDDYTSDDSFENDYMDNDQF